LRAVGVLFCYDKLDECGSEHEALVPVICDGVDDGQLEKRFPKKVIAVQYTADENHTDNMKQPRPQGI